MPFTRTDSWHVEAAGFFSVLSPVLPLLSYLFASLFFILHSDKTSHGSQKRNNSILKPVTIKLTVGIVLLFLGESVLLSSEDLSSALHINPKLDIGLFSTLVWVILLLGLLDTDPAEVAFRFCGPWAIKFVLEAVAVPSSLVASSL